MFSFNSVFVVEGEANFLTCFHEDRIIAFNRCVKRNKLMDATGYTFLRVVDAGSMKAAAEQLGTDPSSISRRIGALEARLGVKLLRRSTRRSTPTEAGQAYYEGLRRLLEQQETLEATIGDAQDNPKGLLRVAAPVDFGARFVAPVLQSMQRAHSDLQIDLQLGSRALDLSEQAIDVAVRIGRLPDSALRCRHLGDVPRVIVASKQYLDTNGRPQEPEDLAKHNFIFYGRHQSQLPIRLHGPGSVETVSVSSNFSVNSITAIQRLVSSGAGMHLGPTWAFNDGLKSGDLERVLPAHGLEAFPVHALYPASAFVPAKVRVFIDMMVARTADESFAVWSTADIG